MSLILIAVASGVALEFYRHAVVWTPLQRFYLSAYTRSALANSLGTRAGRYRLLTVVDRRGSRLAIDDEVVPITTKTGETTFALSDLAFQVGGLRLAWRDPSYPHARLHQDLRTWIYEDQSLTDLARPALIGALSVFALGLLLAVPKDLARARARRHGRR